MNTPSKPQSRWIKFSALSMVFSALLGQSQVHAQTTASSILNPEEVKGLLHMIEEEKLAGDVYQTLYAKTGLVNFKNIAASERRHQAAVQNLLYRYGITDPTTGKGVGEFTQLAFTALYQNLIKQSAQSNADALKVGLKIEDLDIDDLDKESSRTQRTDIQQVYANLTRGSRNHLRSFDRTLRQMGQTYTPEFISQAQYNAIASSPQEKGNQTHAGKGQGQGQGRGQGMGMNRRM